MKEVPLSRGLVALVDDEDHERVSKHKWSASSQRGEARYAVSRVKQADGSASLVYLHRFILDAAKGSEIDHVNGDGLDNRRSNLRFCTHAENARNSRSRRGASSQFKGVFWDNHFQRWVARIGLPGKWAKCLGYFKNEMDAALTYDAAARRHFGEFARCNFPSTEREATS